MEKKTTRSVMEMNIADLRKKLDDGDYEVPRGVYEEKGRVEYGRQEGEARERFKDDLLDCLGITGHPKAEELWRQAWVEGHSSGFHEVMYHAEEIVELLEVNSEWSNIWPEEPGCYWFYGRYPKSAEAPSILFVRVKRNAAGVLESKFEGVFVDFTNGVTGFWKPLAEPSIPEDGEM